MQINFRKTCASFLLFAAVTASAAQRPGWLGFGYLNQTRVERGKVIRSWFVVRHVLPGSPAERAGLRVGDLITAIDGRALRYASDADAIAAMSRVKPQQRLRFAISRLDQRLVVTLVAAPMPDAAWQRWQQQTRRP